MNDPIKPTPSGPDEPSRQSASLNRLQAIARGDNVAAAIHDELAREQAVLEVRNFDFWYGEKQALCAIGMAMPKGKITAIIGPSGCGTSTR